MTFSIVARSDDGESWGVAVASKFLAVGSAVPAAAAGVGAVATQALANVGWKYVGLAHLDDGAGAQETVDRLVAEDDQRDQRQIGVVDADGGAATFTGPGCLDWAGGVTGRSGERGGYAVQGNLLTGPGVVDAMREAWVASTDLAFQHRLLTALAAGDDAGGDRRGRQSAALLVVREGAGYDGVDDTAVDLRVDDHPRPVEELGRLLSLHGLYLTASTPEEQVALTPELLADLEQRVRRLGHEDLAVWVGTENFEMRADPAAGWIDRRVLDILRRATD